MRSAGRLGIEPTAMIRLPAGVNYALLEAVVMPTEDPAQR